MQQSIPYYVIVFIFGALIGSFLNVVIYRTPQLLLELWSEEEAPEAIIPDRLIARFLYACRYFASNLWYTLAYPVQDFWQESVYVLKGLSFPASHCGNCQTPIEWYHNLPILSWFILGGQCKHCQQSYSFRYPAIELSTACLLIYIFWMHGLTSDFFWWSLIMTVAWAIFWIDFDTHFVFNVMTYPSILLGILYNGSKASLMWSLSGGLLAWLFFELTMFLSILLLKKEGMGGGDVKLAVLIGVWLGPALTAVALALSFLIGTLAGILLLINRRQSQPFPFGPFMVLGMFISMSVGDHLWAWYIGKSVW